MNKNQGKNGKGQVKSMSATDLKQTLEEQSVNRIKTVTDAMFKTINDTAEELKKDGKGEVTVTEVTSILLQMAYNYNGRNLKAEHEPKIKE